MRPTIEKAGVFLKQKKYQEAIDTCNQILAKDGNSIEALILIANSLLALKKVEEARIYLNKALNL